MHPVFRVGLLPAIIGALCVAHTLAPSTSRDASNPALVMRPDARMHVDNLKGVYYMHVMKTGGSTMHGLFSLLAKDRSLGYVTFEDPNGPQPTPEQSRTRSE